MRLDTLPALLLGALGLLAPAIQAQSLDPLVRLGTDRLGPAHELTRSGNLVYLAAGAALLVLDVTEPEDPVALGRLELDFVPEELRVTGTTLVAAAGERGLVLIDVADPARPVESARIDTPGFVAGVAVKPGLAFVADSVVVEEPPPPAPRGLLVVDIADPQQPHELGSHTCGVNGARDVAVFGSRAYVMCNTTLHVLDISDPAQPAPLAQTHLGSCWSLVVSGDGHRLYALRQPSHDDGNELRIWDVTDPSAIAPLGGLWEYDRFQSFAVVWDRLYASRQQGLWVYDVSDPADPTPVATLAGHPASDDLALGGDRLYAAARASGLQILDVSGWPVAIGGFATPGASRGVAIEGGRAYVTGDDDRVRILEVSDPAQVVELFSYAGTGELFEGLAADVEVADHRLFLLDARGLDIEDVSGPLLPQPLGRLDLAQAPRAMALGGATVYIGTDVYPAGGLVVIDVADPAQPVAIGALDSVGVYPETMALAGTRLLVAGGVSGGCRIVDVADPTRPVLTGWCDVGDYVWDVATAGDLAFLPGSFGLHVVDISNPSAPVEIGSLPASDVLYTQVALSGAVVFLTSHRGDLELVDVHDPTAPARLGSVPRASGGEWSALPVNLVARGGRVYLTESEAGLSIWAAPLFLDGFESGDVTAWSATAP